MKKTKKLDIKDFIQKIKKELQNSDKEYKDDTFFIIRDIELENDFTVDYENKEKLQLFFANFTLKSSLSPSSKTSHNSIDVDDS